MKFNQINIQELQLDHSIDVNPASGQASAMVNFPLPEGRNGFGPGLRMQYSSSSRNSVFGIGWSLSGLNFISLDTQQGLPKYDGSDTFAFNGSDSLIPQLVKAGKSWKERVDETPTHWIYYYRSEYESSFLRFEKWVDKTNRDVHWRSRSKENIVSIYGRDPTGSSRIFNPEHPDEIFTWLLDAQYDESGNCIQYVYIAENGDQVDPLVSYETKRIRRFREIGFAQKYPERILYGNSLPLSADTATPAANQWLFEVIFDYGQYPNRPFVSSKSPPGATWNKRADPFSVYQPGFEIRTYRLCKRLLIYHHFDELSTPTSLTGIFECKYGETESGTTLQAVAFTGVRRDLQSGAYSEKQLPELTFAYTEPALGRTFKGIAHETNENLPQGFNQRNTQLIDLFGEGIPGILHETASTWYYKPNHGDGVFGRQELVIQKPSHDLGVYSLGDFDQDGNLNLFTLQGRTAGFYEYDRDRERWSGYQTFEHIPQVAYPKFIDVNADGFADLVMECEDKIVCYPFLGKEGFDKPYEFAKPISNGLNYAPTLGDDLSLDYFLADMTGDGLPDQVRIKNGRVEYYPNLGNGHFGDVVLMENSPVTDFDSTFDASRIRLYDLDGNSTTDILYIGSGEIRYWYNALGNKFVDGGRLTHLPYIDNISSAIILDLLGQGMPCLVWSTSLNQFQNNSLHYLELTNGVKPRLMTSLENGMGKEVQISYGHSGQHYLNAKKSGKPWISKIPSHFTVVDKKIVIDHITNTQFVAQYKYFDGHYDGNERNFVTFGLVEQYDAELYPHAAIPGDKSYVQPHCTRTWLHNGLFGWDTQQTKQFYKQGIAQSLLAPAFFEQDEALDSEEFKRGYRSLAGRVLRQEVYATNAQSILEPNPLQISQTGYCIRKLQPKTELHESCFYAYQTEALSITYEQDPQDPRIAHHFSVAINNYGDIEKELSISYARSTAAPERLPAQSRDYITTSIHSFLHVDSLQKYQTGLLYESKDYDVNRIAHNSDEILQLEDVQAVFDGLINGAIEFDQPLPQDGTSLARLISWDRTYFWNDAFDNVLPLGKTGVLVFAHHEESACFNNKFIAQVFAGSVTSAMLSDADEGNYLLKDGYWWQHTAINHFKGANGFYSLERVERNPGNITTYKYDPYDLNIIEIRDPLGNITKGEIDYNIVEPYRLIDQNDNASEVLYDPLGVAVATFHQGTVLNAGTLQKYGTELSADYSQRNDESFDAVLTNPGLYLQKAATFLFYDFERWKKDAKPLRSISLTRENLVHDGKGNIDNAIVFQLEVDYQDGFGRIIQSKRLVEPGPAIRRKADGSIELDAAGEPVLSYSNPRWLVTGHVVYNNKQQPVRQFEPFFSTIFEFENDGVLETYGVSAQNNYDAVGRISHTNFPNGTFTEVKFAAWDVQSFDQNDTLDRSDYKLFRQVLPASDPERMALDRSLAHKDTPSHTKLDPLGREIVTTEKNNNGTQRKIENNYDIHGNLISIKDARDLNAFEYTRDMLGRLCHEKSIDAGEKWNFHDNDDQAIHLWDGRSIHQRIQYDSLERVISVYVDGALGLDQITERFLYGEDASISQAKEKNLRGQLVTHFDQAGTQEVKLAIPGGTPVLVERRLFDQFTSEANWDNPATVVLEAERYVSEYTYDGLGRPIVQSLPDQTTRKFTYNRGGGLQKVFVSTADGSLDEVELLRSTSYDAKGLRQTALLGNDVEITYTYDTESFRLERLQSRRISGTPRTYQDIHYTYDPIGNLIHLIDEAQQPATPLPHVIEGLNVSAHSEFEYDALYQLKVAKGRVHQALLQHDYADRSREAGVPANWGKGTRHITLNNGAAVERYTRIYECDKAGNIKSIRHAGASQNWTTPFWISNTSNRSLPAEDLQGNAITSPESRFDENGNCIYLPHLRSIHWNYRNQMAKAVVIDRSAGGKPNDEEYYVYGGDGLRVRKVTQRVIDVANGTIELTEKIYLDGCEIKRISRGNIETLKRFTSHITDGINSIARIHAWEKDTHARETDDITKKKIHYQLVNHLGSSSLELDEAGNRISYEEYFPRGGTAFLAGRNKREIDLKDYRYCGKERDDFTGLYYFGYRYYAHWLGGWISPDPLGPEDSENLYLYVHNNPINLVDPNGLQTNVRVRKGELYGIDPRDLPANLKAGFIKFLKSRTQKERDEDARLGRTIPMYDFRSRKFRMVTKAEADAFIKESTKKGLDVGYLTEPEPELNEENFGASGTITVEEDEGTVITADPELSLPGDKPAIGPDGGTADSSGKGKSNDTSSGGTNNGTGKDGSRTQSNSGGGGGNTGDGGTGSGNQARGSGAGKQGTGTGGGGTAAKGTGTTSTIGLGSGTGAGSGAGAGTGGKKGSGQRGSGTRGNGRPEGQVGGSRDGTQGGRIGGVPDGTLGGQLDGTPGGSLEGDVNGIPEGAPDGSPEGTGTTTGEGTGSKPGDGNQAQPGQAQGTQKGTSNPSGQGENQDQQSQQGQQGQGQPGDPNANWMDKVTKWAGYLNLETGEEKGGEAGGVPGGMDLFGWRPPMWVRRIAQVAYIATTIITTVIPIGKIAIAAKVAIQAVMKAGLKATAKKLLTAAAAKLPSRAAIKGTLTRAKNAVSSTLSRLREKASNLFRRNRRSFREMMDPNELKRYEEYWQNYSPKQVQPGIQRLDHTRISGRTGRMENSRVIYDDFGRQRYRVDYTDHMRPSAHTNPHLHETIYDRLTYKNDPIEYLYNLLH